MGLQADDEVEAAAAVRRDAGDAVLAAQFVFFVRDGDFDEGGVCREFGAGKAQMVERLFAVGIQAAAAGEVAATLGGCAGTSSVVCRCSPSCFCQ